jgi:hypothetical protein
VFVVFKGVPRMPDNRTAFKTRGQRCCMLQYIDLFIVSVYISLNETEDDVAFDHEVILLETESPKNAKNNKIKRNVACSV